MLDSVAAASAHAADLKTCPPELAADTMERGTRTLDFVEFSRRFERIGSNLSLGAGSELVHGSTMFLTRHAETGLSLLFDPDTFQETYLFARHRCVDFGMQGKELPGEGVVTGYGLVAGRPLYAVSQDFTVAGGAVGEATARKISDLQDDAMKTGDPIIFINDSGGARIQEGVDALAGYGDIFYRNIKASGVVPQISIISGPCAGGAAPIDGSGSHGYALSGSRARAHR